MIQTNKKTMFVKLLSCTQLTKSITATFGSFSFKVISVMKLVLTTDNDNEFPYQSAIDFEKWKKYLVVNEAERETYAFVLVALNKK